MGGLKLERRQIFGMKKESLFKRVVKYFEQTKNVSEVDIFGKGFSIGSDSAKLNV